MKAALAAAMFLAMSSLGARAAPALWLVQSPTTKIYLFGTMHILPKKLPWFTGKPKAAFDAADELWEEADVSSAGGMGASDMMRLGVDPNTDVLSLIPADEAKTFKAELEKCHLTGEVVTHFRPWLAALMPTICDIMAQSEPAAKAGKTDDTHPDQLLASQATEHLKRTKFFETVADQLGYLSNAPQEAQIQQLRKAIKESATGKDDFTGLENAWFNGDTAAIAKAVLQMRGDSEAFYQTILAQRNVRFAARIKELLTQPGIIFVAVGAGHLAGPDSVQAQLEKSGIHSSFQ